MPCSAVKRTLHLLQKLTLVAIQLNELITSSRLNIKEHFNLILHSRHCLALRENRVELSSRCRIIYFLLSILPGQLYMYVIKNLEFIALHLYFFFNPLYFTLSFCFFFLSLSFYLFLYLFLSFRLCVAELFFNEHFL